MYELTGGPAGTLGAAAAVALRPDDPLSVRLTVTIVITIAITASAAPTGASRTAHGVLVAPAERPPLSQRRPGAAGSPNGGTLSGSTVSAAARAAARIRSSIVFMLAPPGSGRARPVRARWWT